MLKPDLEANALLGVFEDLDMPHVPVLARMERWGLAIDPDALHRRRHTCWRPPSRTSEREVFAAVGHEFQIGSPQQLSQVLFAEIGLPKTRKTATGYTTDATALEPLRHVHPAVDAVMRWREVTKIKSTYVDTLPRAGQPAHGAHPQRLLAGDRRHRPALLERPEPAEHPAAHRDRQRRATRLRGARLRRVAPVPARFDYSQIELRVLAHMCGDDELREAFDGGPRHPRRHLGARLQRAARRTSRPRCAAARRSSTSACSTASPPSGSHSARASPATRPSSSSSHYFEAYPSVAAWRDRVVDEARARGYAATLTGRRRYIPDLRASNRNQRMAAERVAINMPIQGTAADIIKIAMNAIDRELLERQSRGARARMVLQVHDELIFELPASEADDVRELAHRLMPSLELAVPLVIEEKSGRSWGDFA